MKLNFIYGIIGILACQQPTPTTPMNASPFPFREKQPDGSFTPLMRMNGNTHYHHLSDMDGYTILEDSKKWFVYADEDLRTGDLKSSGLRFGKGSPQRQGLKKHLIPKKKNLNKRNLRSGSTGSDIDLSEPDDHSHRQLAATGTLKNLVILIRFSDHKDRILPTKQEFHMMFNNVGGNPTFAPSGSVRDVFRQSSFGKLNLESYVHPWITLPNTEAYYADGNAGLKTKMKEGLALALNQIKPYTNFKRFDRNKDGNMDGLTFIHSGYAAESGQTDCYGVGKDDRIWSHKAGLVDKMYPQGVKVQRYNIAPGLHGVCGNDIGRIGVASHELGHFLGLPDLYDGEDGSGLGSFCLMGNSWGFDESQWYPPIMSTWSRTFLGWMTPTVIDNPGTYSLKAAANNPVAYKITKGFPEGEYLLIENRLNTGFDQKIVQGGLAIFHIDEKTETESWGDINTIQGYPGQQNWPQNGKHYRVAVLQADGNYDLEKDTNRGDGGDLFHSKSKMRVLGPSTSNKGPFPNTDSYQGGNVKSSGWWIHDMSEPGEVMTFTLSNKAPEPPHDYGERSLETIFKGGTVNDGNMFDIVAKNDITITSMDLRIETTDIVTVEVYTKAETCRYFGGNSNVWTKIATATVRGRGKLGKTPLPENSFRQFVAKGQKQAFYVFLTNSSTMGYSSGIEFGRVFAQNDDVQILEGYGNRKHFGGIAIPRVWNGVLHYSVEIVSENGSKSLTTIYKMTGRNSGIMFDIVAKNDLTINNFDLHLMWDKKETIEVYTTLGPAMDKNEDSSQWTKLGGFVVQAKGRDQVSTLPLNGIKTVTMKAGEKRAFYIASPIESVIVMSHGNKGYGQIAYQNSDLEVLEGIGKRHSNLKIKWEPRVFNGGVHYTPIKPKIKKELSTTFQGGSTFSGVMFDVDAKKDLTVTGMDLHINTLKTIKVLVYTSTETASDAHNNRKIWTKVAHVRVKCNGPNEKTPLPEGSLTPVVLKKGEKRAFYVATPKSLIMYTEGKRVGKVYRQNVDMAIRQGFGKAYGFKEFVEPRVFNGVLKYEV